MEKSRRVVAVILFAITGFALVDCSMQKVAGRREGYTRANLWAYYFYTDSEIRNAPKVTKAYHFTFTAQDGSQPQDSGTVFGAGHGE